MERKGIIRRTVTAIKNMRFQYKLLMGYLLACVIPLLFVSAIIFNESAEGLEESSEEFASLYTSQIKTNLNEFIQEYDKVTKSVLVDNDLINSIGEEDNMPIDELIIQKVGVQRLLMRVALLKPEIGTVMLISRNNSMYQYGAAAGRVNEQALLTQDWYKRIQSSDDTFFITGLHDRSYYEDKGAGAIVTVGRVLFNYDGAYAGILLIDLDPFSLLRLDHEFVLARDKYGMSVIISNNQAEIVYHSDAASGRLSWQEVLESGQDYINSHSEDNIILTGSTTLGNLFVKTEIPRSLLLHKINQIQGLTITVIIMSCLVITLISFGLSYTITKPIKALRRSMKQAEAGQYLPINKEQTNDEIGSLVHSYNKMIITIRTLIKDVYIAEIKQKQAKLIALQNQINPHMLYNTLESIRMKTMVKGDDETADMIKILSRMFRLALHKEGKHHSIRHELDYTINYLKLQNIRFENMFKLFIKIPDDMMECSIIPLIFQPIVENSINHGIKDYEHPLHIEVEGIWTNEGEILIRLSDDGAGLTAQKQDELCAMLEDAESDKYKLEQTETSESNGIGLKNIAERIKIQYGDRYYVSIQSRPDRGTTVELLIPKR